VSILIAEASEMQALDVFDLALAHEVNMIMDGRSNHECDAMNFERVLGPCYTRLLDSPRAKGLYIDKVTGIANTWRGLTTTILVLADAGQAEQLAVLVKDACKTCVQVRLVENGAAFTGQDSTDSHGLNGFPLGSVEPGAEPQGQQV